MQQQYSDFGRAPQAITPPNAWDEAKKPAQPTATINLFDQLHAWGYQGVPIIPGKKWPGQKIAGQWEEMTRWQKLRSTSADRAQWHSEGAGVGIVAGHNTFALDIDTDDAGLAQLIEDQALRQLGPSPCRVGREPRRALFYAVSQPFKKTQSGDPSKGAGVEFRTGNHQTVAYGIHPNGKAYSWTRPLVPKDQLTMVSIEKLRSFKAWCDDLLGKSGKDVVTAAERGEVNQEKLKGPIELVAPAVSAIPNDNSKDFDRDLWVTACHAIAAATADYPVEGFEIWDAFSQRHPTYDEDNTLRAWETIGNNHRTGARWLYDQALTYSKSFAQTLIDHFGWFDSVNDAESADEVVEVTSIDGPPEDLGLFLFPSDDDDDMEPQDPFGYSATASALDLCEGVFPEIIDTFASDQSRRVGMPKAFVALSAFVTLAGSIGNKVHIQPKANDTEWREPAILWGVMAGSVSTKKTPAMRAAVAPLSKVDAERAAEGYQRYMDWERNRKLATSRDAKAALPPEPTIERNLVVNATIEAVAEVLGDSPAGVLLYHDELTAWLGSMDAYKSSKGGDRGLWLQFFNGDRLPIDRVGRKQKPVKFFGGSILGGVQPDKIREMASNLGADGLLQRFLVIYVDDDSDDSDQDVDEAPDYVAGAAYRAIVTKWAKAPSDLPPMVVRLSDEAQAVWRPLAGQIRALRHEQGMSDAWVGHLGKMPGITARVLLLCHLLDNANLETHEVDSVLVSASTARRAVKLCGALIMNSLRFYSECIGGGEPVDDARWIAGHILTKPEKTRFSRNDIGNARHEMRGQDERIERAMKMLEHIDWVRPNLESWLDSRRRPTQWTICPKVHDGRFASQAQKEERERRAKQASIREAGRVRAQIMGASSVFD